MSDVSCKMFVFFEDASRHYGFSLENLTEGTSLTLAEYRNPANRCTWAEWIVLATRMEAIVGPDEMIVAGGRANQLEFARPLRRLAAGILNTKQLYFALFRWISPAYFRNVDFQFEVISADHFHVSTTVAADQPDSSPWFRVAMGTLRKVPDLLGLEDAVVRAEITEHHAHFDVHCPPSRSIGSRLQNRIRAMLSFSTVLDELHELQKDVRKSYLELVEVEREHRAVLNALPHPVVVLKSGRAVFSNLTWQRDFGSSELPQALREKLDVCIGNRTEHLDLEIVTAGGRRRLFAVAPVVPMRFSGLPAGLLLLRDVTEHRAQAVQQSVASRLTTLGSLAATIGHEINNPLGYAIGSLELVLENDGEMSDDARDQVEAALDGLARVREISGDLQTFARPPSEHEILDLHTLLDSALRLAANQTRHIARTERELARSMPSVLGDPSQLTQVFLQLIINATQAMFETEQDSRLAVRTFVTNKQVVVEISDTGHGIDPQVRPRVFEPFFSSDDARTGLGLAISRKIIDEHGGQLLLESEVGVGTTVRVVLPAAPEATVDAPGPVPEARTLRVLAIDDEPRFGELLPRLLRKHEVTVVASADALWEVLERDDNWDVVLCDVMLPGYTGVQIHRRLTAERPELARRVIFVTGGAFTDDTREYLGTIDNPTLYKPFPTSSLREAVARMGEHPPEA